MLGESFKSDKEIREVTVAIARLLKKWGIGPANSMFGKYLSHYFLGVFTKPADVLRDTAVYILKDALPWKVDTAARSIVPPKGKFFDDYNALQNKFNIGLDFIPIPGVFLDKSYITKKREERKIGGFVINFESVEKFVGRMNLNHAQFDGKSREDIRNFYYVDEKRYHDRLDFYTHIDDFFKKNKAPAKVRKLSLKMIQSYKKMIKFAYPELFSKEVISMDIKQLKGASIGIGKGIIKGTVKLYSPGEAPAPKGKKYVYVFTHFFPADAKILPHAAAIITDGGGALSHAAIVCRELGVPCVVGAGSASKVLRDGDNVEIDITKGIINKI